MNLEKVTQVSQSQSLKISVNENTIHAEEPSAKRTCCKQHSSHIEYKTAMHRKEE